LPAPEYPKISVVTFCLNSGRFLKNTIESVLKQSFTDYEHIIIDGGSTDQTIEILQEHPHLRWVSEKEEGENTVLDAIWKGFTMARGQYVVLLAVSDAILDEQWFDKAVKRLDTDGEISCVWGLSQALSAENDYGKVIWPEYLEKPPPQKMDFLPFWLATGHGLESNAVFRLNIIKECFPKNQDKDPYRYSPTIGLNYRLNTKGYLPFFIPTISFLGRTHTGQRLERYETLIDSVTKRYEKDIRSYRKGLFTGKLTHSYRDGSSRIVKQIGPQELGPCRRKYWEYRIRGKIRRNLLKLLDYI